MEVRYDIRLNKSYINANNDVEWFQSDIIHIEDTIQANPGSYKENPSDGVGIMNFLSGSGIENDLIQKTIFELQKDSYNCNNPIVTFDSNGKLILDPNITV